MASGFPRANSSISFPTIRLSAAGVSIHTCPRWEEARDVCLRAILRIRFIPRAPGLLTIGDLGRRPLPLGRMYQKNNRLVIFVSFSKITVA